MSEKENDNYKQILKMSSKFRSESAEMTAV